MKYVLITLIVCTTIYYLWDMTLTYRAEIKRLEKIQFFEDVKNWKYGGH